jgi:hypothetical protein
MWQCYHTPEMSKRFFKLTAVITPLHALVTITCDYLALGTLFVDVRRQTYSQRLSVLLAKLFAQPSTAILDRFGIDFGSAPWELLFLVLNSMIWGAAIAAMISFIPRRSNENAAKSCETALSECGNPRRLLKGYIPIKQKVAASRSICTADPLRAGRSEVIMCGAKPWACAILLLIFRSFVAGFRSELQSDGGY